MATNNELGFFTPLLMVAGQGVSRDFAVQELVKPVERMTNQLTTAMKYKNTPENLAGLKTLEQCAEGLTRALNAPAAMATKGAENTAGEPEEPTSPRPSFW